MTALSLKQQCRVQVYTITSFIMVAVKLILIIPSGSLFLERSRVSSPCGI